MPGEQKKVCIDVPYIDQSKLYPTGCESVSTVMLLRFLGIDITVDEFIEKYLEKKSFEERDGQVYGPDPHRYFCGSPYDDESFGCYAPVIREALEKIIGAEYTVTDETGMTTDELVEKYVNMVIGDDQGPSEWNLKELNEILIPMIPVKPVTGEGCGSKQELIQNLKEEALRLYETKEAEFPEPEQIREIERVIILKVTDSRWMDHIDDMDQLRQGIGLQAFGQRDPVVEYRLQGYDMFNDMTESIREETVKMLMHVRIEQKVEREQVAEVTGTNKDDSANAPIVRKSEKISRNAPCPCGSGKKYKYCCGRAK